MMVSVKGQRAEILNNEGFCSDHGSRFYALSEPGVRVDCLHQDCPTTNVYKDR